MALLCATALLALSPALLQNAVPMELHGPLFMPPWEEARPAGLEPVANTHWAQQASRYYPWYQRLNQVGDGEASLLWNPLEGFGAPFLALWRTRALSPFSLPVYLLPLETGIVVSFLAKLAVAGILAYYTARRFGFPPGIAAFAGVCFQWAGPVLGYLPVPVSDAAVWFPLWLMFLELIALGQSRSWVLGAVALLLAALGGEPYALFMYLAFGLVYLLLRRLLSGAERVCLRPALPPFLLAVGVGLSLAAVQLAPWIELLLQSALSIGSGGVALPAPIDGLAFISPAWLPESRAEAMHGALLLHVGLPPLLLFPLYLAVRPFLERVLRDRMESLAIAGVAFAGLAYALLAVLDALPGSPGAAPFFVAYSLGFVMLAATAAEEWLELDPEEVKQSLQRLTWLLPPVWLIILAGAIFGSFAGSDEISIFDTAVPVVVAILLLALLGVTLIKPKVYLMGYGLAVMAAVSFSWAYGAILPKTPAAEVFPETGFVQKLDAMEARVAGSRALAQWPLAAHGIPQVFSPSGVRLKRYVAFANAAEDDPLLLRRSGAEALLLTREDIQGDFGVVRPVLKLQEVFPSGAVLFRDLEIQPRARMIYSGISTGSLHEVPLDSSQPPILEGTALPGTMKAPVEKKRIVVGKDSSDVEIELEVEQTPPGILVLADMWYPGWEAYVDGRATPIIPVDKVFRGVELGEGAHEVVFRYNPMSLKVGGVISIFALAVLLYALGHSLRREKKRA